MHIDITKEALSIISILAEGAMRDALSILERCLQDGETKIDENKIKDLVGIPKLTFIQAVMEAIIDNKVEDALKIIDEVVKDGKDIQNFLWEIIKYAKDILVYQASKKAPLYSAEETKKLEELATKVDKQTILSMVYALSNLENEIKWSSQKLILFQVTIIKLCTRDIMQDRNEQEQIQQLEQKINYLQKQIESLSKEELIHKKEINVDNVVPKTVIPTQKMSQETVARNNIRIQQSKPGENLACWSKILKELKESGKIMLYTNLMNTTAKEINDMTVGIIFSKEMTPFGKTILEKAENQTELERKVSMELGKTMRIKYIENRQEKTVVEQGSTTIENFAENLDLPIHIIE